MMTTSAVPEIITAYLDLFCFVISSSRCISFSDAEDSFELSYATRICLSFRFYRSRPLVYFAEAEYIRNGVYLLTAIYIFSRKEFTFYYNKYIFFSTHFE